MQCSPRWLDIAKHNDKSLVNSRVFDTSPYLDKEVVNHDDAQRKMTGGDQTIHGEDRAHEGHISLG